MAVRLEIRDIEQIKKILLTPVEEELKTREIFPVTNEFDPDAVIIGYEIYNRKGSAKLYAAGGVAKDIPFVGEEIFKSTQQVYTAVTGVQYTEEEIAATRMREKFGNRAVVNLPMQRNETARRFVLETETMCAFKGGASYGAMNLNGIFAPQYYGTLKGTMTQVAQSVANPNNVAGAANLRMWANKSPQEILADLRVAYAAILGTDGIFKPNTLVVPPSAWAALNEPFSNYINLTVLDWIKKSIDIENFVMFSQVAYPYNGDGSGQNYFLMMDSDPMNMQLAVVRDIYMTNPDIDNMTEVTKYGVKLKTGGVLVYQPAAIYVGQGI